MGTVSPARRAPERAGSAASGADDKIRLSRGKIADYCSAGASISPPRGILHYERNCRAQSDLIGTKCIRIWARERLKVRTSHSILYQSLTQGANRAFEMLEA